MDGLLIIILGAIAAGFVQGLTGFAFAMVSMSFWVWVVDPHITAALVVFGSLAGQILSAFSVKRGVSFQLLWPYILGGLAGIPFGVALLPILNVDWFKTFIGLFLTIACPVMLLSNKIPPIKTQSKTIHGIVGIISGILSGLGGISGVLISVWTSLCHYDKNTQRNVVQNFSLSMLVVTMGIYIYKGFITTETLHLFAIVLPAMLIPSWLGAHYYKKIPSKNFRQLVLLLLTFSGISMLISSVPKII